MPRKPFHQFYKAGMAYLIGPGRINDRPELASLVGQCVAMWSDVELQMALLLGAILKTNSDAAVALFLAIKTSRTQRDALSTVARLLLIGHDLDAFEALLIVYASLEKQRNALAHGLFGISDAIPDAILWSDTQDHANFLINVYLHEYKGKPLPDPHEKLRSDMFVYTRKDLEDLLRDLTELQKAAFHFHCHHQPRESKPQNHLKDMLVIPSIQEALQAVRQKRTDASQ
jgi:hypothetical protein